MLPLISKAQVGIAVRVEGADTIPVYALSEVKVVREKKFASAKQKAKWDKLKRDVKKAYPYALLAEAKLKEYDSQLKEIKTEMARKKFMERAENEMKKQFEADLKKLTLSQGKILIKLIDRQTGSTSYELVKQLRGSFSAFMWQGVARLFGSSLKTEYDGKGGDKMIEDAIYLLESGEI